jgi:CHASE2 domain-containing sensor protein
MAIRSDHVGAKLLPLIEHVAIIPAVGVGVFLIGALVSPLHSALQVVLLTAAAVVASYSAFFLRATLQQYRTLRRLLHEGGAAEKPEPYLH